jgi:hypothetical protein
MATSYSIADITAIAAGTMERIVRVLTEVLDEGELDGDSRDTLSWLARDLAGCSAELGEIASPAEAVA